MMGIHMQLIGRNGFIYVNGPKQNGPINLLCTWPSKLHLCFTSELDATVSMKSMTPLACSILTSHSAHSSRPCRPPKRLT